MKLSDGLVWALIVQQFAIAGAYLFQHDLPRFVYWLAGACICIATLFIK